MKLAGDSKTRGIQKKIKDATEILDARSNLILARLSVFASVLKSIRFQGIFETMSFEDC